MTAVTEKPKPPSVDNRSIFLSNLHYFYGQTDGTYKYPEGAVGDLLKQAKAELEAMGKTV